MWKVLVGATGHEPRGNLQHAFPALARYGVNVTSLDRCGKFAFVALKGSPERTASVLKKSAEGNAWLVVKVLGTYIRSTFVSMRNFLSVPPGLSSLRSKPILWEHFVLRVYCTYLLTYLLTYYKQFAAVDWTIYAYYARPPYEMRVGVCLSVRPSVRQCIDLTRERKDIGSPKLVQWKPKVIREPI